MSGATASLPDLGAVRDAVTNAQTSRVTNLLAGTRPSAPISALTAEQLMAQLDPATLAHLATLVAAKGGMKN